MFSDKTYPTCHGCILKSIPHLLFGGGWPLDYIKFLGAAEEEWLPLVTRRLTNSGGRLLPQPVGLALALLLQQPVAILILSKTSPMTTKSVCSVEERLMMIRWWCDVCATGWSSWQRMMLEVVVFYTCTTSSCTRLRYVDQAGGRKGGFRGCCDVDVFSRSSPRLCTNNNEQPHRGWRRHSPTTRACWWWWRWGCCCCWSLNFVLLLLEVVAMMVPYSVD